MLGRILWLAALLLGLPAAAVAGSQGLNQLKAGAVDTSPHYKELHMAPSSCVAPCLDYALSAELEDDWVFAASPPSLRSNDLYPTLESAIILAPLNHVRLIGDFIFEPVKDPRPGESTAFADLGAYVDQLYVEVEYGAFNLQIGKIHPSFGQAWDVTPGLHATDIPGNYELEERMGMGMAYEFDALGFDNVLQASLFTTDRTVLSGSIFTHRPRTTLSDGGAGNTTGVSSVSMTLDGCVGGAPVDCYADGELGYNFGARFQRAGQGDAAGELGFVAGANRTLTLDDVTLRLFGEVAFFRNFEGSRDDALFLTASSELDIDAISCSLAYTLQQNLSGGSDQLIELAAGYNLGEAYSLAGEEWSIAVGYSFNRNEGQDTHLIGVLLTVDLNGSLPSATAGRRQRY